MVGTKRQTETRTHAGVTHINGAGVLPVIRLDDLHLPVCDLLYLDIEGYEIFALRGALETIRRCRPVVACEVNGCAARYGVAPGAVANLLKDEGYEWVRTVRSDEIFKPKA